MSENISKMHCLKSCMEKMFRITAYLEYEILVGNRIMPHNLNLNIAQWAIRGFANGKSKSVSIQIYLSLNKQITS